VDDFQAVYEASGELRRLLLDEGQLEPTLMGIGRLAVSVIPSCEEAGVTLEKGGQVSMRVTTGPTAEKVDSYQYEIEEGPCVAAADTHKPVLIDDMAREHRWPRFVSFATSRGVKSSYAIPMILNDEMIGVLNLYSVDNAFGPTDEQIGTRFADQAAVAVRHFSTFNKAREMIDHLHRALETRDVIGAAVGITMFRDHLTMEAALTLLKEISQRENLKLRQIAENIVGQFEAGDRAPVETSD
jgi:GAF domain-containing protein